MMDPGTSRTALRVGTLVIHPKRPEWGLGKIITVQHNGVHVIWRDLDEQTAKKINTTVVRLQIADVQHDDILDNMPPLIEKDGKYTLPHARMTFVQAVEKFLSCFPRGFHDPAYIGGTKGEDRSERAYKLAAHEDYVSRLGAGRYDDLLSSDPSRLCDELKRCERSLNLLSPYEKAALSDALDVTDAALPFLHTLGDILRSETITESQFTPYSRAVGNLPAERGRVATWPVATIFPYLAQPDRHMFLKPTVTKKAADIMAFNLNYDAAPNWLTYSRLLEMARIYKEQLVQLKPRDMIDVQSFFWVTCGGYDELYRKT